MKKCVDFLLFYFLPLVILGQNTPVLVKDMSPGQEVLPLLAPTEYGTINGDLYTRGTLGNQHDVLWKVNPATSPTLVSAEVSRPTHFTELQGDLYFFVPADGKAELWKTDGTTGQTSLVKQIYYGQTLPNPPDALVKAGDLLFFEGYDNTNGLELWRSDGTAAGTFLVKDLNPGPGFSYISSITAFGSKVVFFGYDEPNTDQNLSLFISDGTAAGTVKLYTFPLLDNPYWGVHNTRVIAAADTQVFFVANDGTSGLELWKTDGTAAGTSLVRDIQPGSAGSQPNYLTSNGSQVIFYAQDSVEGREVWRSDGTPGGTTRIKQTAGTAGIAPTNDVSSPGVESAMLVHNGQVWFFYVTEGGTGYQIEVCRTTGTAVSTQILHTHQTIGTNAAALVYARFLGVAAEQMTWIFKNTADFPVDFELWKSDGSTSTLVKADLPSVEFAVAGQSVGQHLFFTTYVTQEELWRTDGTAAGTAPVVFSKPNDTHPAGFVTTNDLVFFNTDALLGSPAGIPRATGIWSSDGTAAGTMPSDQDTVSGRVFSSLATAAGQAFFIRADWPDYQTGVFSLFRVTAPDATPVQVGTTWSSTFNISHWQPVAHKNKVFFVKNAQIWQSDGTEGGTTLYFDPPADPAPNYARRVGDLASNGDSLYFINYRWQLDGPYSTGDWWSISGMRAIPALLF